MLGGLASTTAATASFARSQAGEPKMLVPYLRAAVIANTMHHPRIFAVLLLATPQLAMACLPALAAMALAGLAGHSRFAAPDGRGLRRTVPSPVATRSGWRRR